MGSREPVYFGVGRDDRVRVNDGRFRVTNRTKLMLIEACTIITIGVVAFTVLFSVVYAQKLDSSRRAEQIAGCERANQQRRYINEIILRQHLQMPPIVTPICAEIIH